MPPSLERRGLGYHGACIWLGRFPGGRGLEGRSGLGFRRARGDKQPEVGSILTSDSCYATPSAPRNRSTKTHGFIRITITITIIQEQIHKSHINNTAARRSPHRFRRTCCPLPQHLQGSLACLSSGRRPGPGSHCLGRSTAAGREPHRFQGICCPLRLHLQ